jgi:hypothetical protein
VDRAGELFSPNSWQNLKIDQVRETFKWLNKEGSLDRFQLGPGDRWENAVALVGAREGDRADLVIPYKPAVRDISVLGVDGAIKLVYMRAELLNIQDGRESPGLDFFSTPVFESRRLSDFPSLQYDAYFENLSLWVDEKRLGELDMDGQALDELRFGLLLSVTSIEEIRTGVAELAHVDDADVFRDGNSRVFGPWSENMVSFTLGGFPDYSLPQITAVKLAEGRKQDQYKYYLIG